MKISYNVKQGTSSGKNSSQTVEIKDKTNEKKPYLEQNISNPKLDGSDQKTNTNTSPEMKISYNVKQSTSSGENSSQTVEIKDKTNEKKPYLEQNISNHKLDTSHKKVNTNTSPEMKISYNAEQASPSGKNSSQTVEIKDKTNEKKPYLEQNISNHKLDTSHKKVNTNTSPEMKISHNAEQASPSGKISSQTVQIKDKTNKKMPYLQQNISNHELNRSNQKANTKTSPEIKIFHNVEQDTSLEFPLYSNKRKFEERNDNFTNKRFRNDQNNTSQTLQSNFIKRKINHEIDKSHKKQKVDNHDISNTSTTNINNGCKLNQNTNKIKNVQVKLTDVMTLIHKQKNQKAYKIAQKDNEICKKYGHNLKICLL